MNPNQFSQLVEGLGRPANNRALLNDKVTMGNGVVCFLCDLTISGLSIGPSAGGGRECLWPGPSGA